ncbi:MAG: winged helix-turn-helix transcriptional regulator [Pseudomonadales bacterium]|nr:winged helix-turn-helix transcriptional regulator [Pseudomonadales bacterium]MCP5183915.1 winged helix-turn-helix transcriptional regulator [Pseudomonadales bacterium]
MPRSGGAAMGALADPTRQDIVRLLAERPSAVGEIAQKMPMSRPAISKHLKVLAEAGLVESRREGTRNIYALREAGVAEVRAWFDQLWSVALRRFAMVAENSRPAAKRGKGSNRPERNQRAARTKPSRGKKA